jgi:hypothetical protein
MDVDNRPQLLHFKGVIPNLQLRSSSGSIIEKSSAAYFDSKEQETTIIVIYKFFMHIEVGL